MKEFKKSVLESGVSIQIPEAILNKLQLKTGDIIKFVLNKNGDVVLKKN